MREVRLERAIQWRRSLGFTCADGRRQGATGLLGETRGDTVVPVSVLTESHKRDRETETERVRVRVCESERERAPERERESEREREKREAQA